MGHNLLVIVEMNYFNCNIIVLISYFRPLQLVHCNTLLTISANQKGTLVSPGAHWIPQSHTIVRITVLLLL